MENPTRSFVSITLTRLEWRILADILSQNSDRVRAAENYVQVIEKELSPDTEDDANPR